MLTLSARKSGPKRSGAARKPSAPRAVVLADEGSFILPRPARRVVRFIVSLCTGKVELPRHIGKVSLAAYVLAVGGYGIVHGGHWPYFSETMTSTAGFAVDNVKLSGNVHISEIDVLQSLGLDGTTSLVSLDVDDARRRVAELPWVAAVEIRKVYPKTVLLNIKERVPFGIWQHGTDLSLIEEDGNIIAPLRDNKFASLPLFVGRDAETDAKDVMAEFAAYPQLTSRVKAYVRIASRRWDLYLDNGVVVKLPEDDVGEALKRLARMETEQQLLERDIAAVDLRLVDRMTVQLTPEALVRRQAAVAARAKAIAKLEKET
ncbi:cell division protein FtsQ [Agrobacterium vitis]|nr:cell division protein FtsQ [Agrobacterium vitis]MBE1437779.1 cell division protein FtsQ [Agrobacterium vitis]